MAKPEIRDIVTILNNPADKKKLQNFIDEAVRCRIKIKDQNESIKNLKAEALLQIGADPKIFGQLVRLFDNNSFAEKRHEIETLEAAIDILIGTAN